MNLYKEILESNLPRLLSLYNQDRSSATYGYGDRLYWGWKISDFPNGTMQGGVHALSIALKLDLIENKKFMLSLIDSAIRAIRDIRSNNGSLSEAYPQENSFCVTAVAAFDTLSAIDHLKPYLAFSQVNEYLEIVRPLILFICKHIESHAIISNHIATAAAACAVWEKLSGEQLDRTHALLGIIYHHQSGEGWYREYEGADPGYQTLATYYLFAAYEIVKDEKLLSSLEKAGRFLEYFIHPDGTLGGLYGSRNTEVYYPAGVVGMMKYSDRYKRIAGLLHHGLQERNHVLPQDIDIGNFIPLINAYAVAALHFHTRPDDDAKPETQARHKTVFAKTFQDAGIYIHSTPFYYAIVNFKKGGTIKVYDKATDTLDIEDGGLFGQLETRQSFSTQQFDSNRKFTDHTIETPFYLVNERLPGALSTIVIRILGFTFFRVIAIGNLFKKAIVRVLMTGKKPAGGKAVRRFFFSDNEIAVKETVLKPKSCKSVGHTGKCKAIHMASSGYFLAQDIQIMPTSKYVRFLQEDDSQIKTSHKCS